MAKVYSPNKKYDGITAGVQFSNGIGETSDKYILEYLKSKGYTVEDNKNNTVDNELEELKKEATALGIKFNGKIGKAKLAEKIKEEKELKVPDFEDKTEKQEKQEDLNEIDPFEDETDTALKGGE